MVDGAGEPELLFPSQQDQAVGSWFPDGTKLAFNQVKPNSNNYDIWILSMDGSHSGEKMSVVLNWSEELRRLAPSD